MGVSFPHHPMRRRREEKGGGRVGSRSVCLVSVITLTNYAEKGERSRNAQSYPMTSTGRKRNCSSGNEKLVRRRKKKKKEERHTPIRYFPIFL